jgi:hypothetical protein
VRENAWIIELLVENLRRHPRGEELYARVDARLFH